ncbi:rhodanese-like domain-containing protein [[Acholeplasma] multilocale]|uniref:rhodanese-like domain-containing protein n=1 Tax=[Acholeplasma] multilocale TaxID=264638 RepID=UPI000479AA1E|nr:rhodanese-like domain-containing protein [[Acholeplasma] multilocale]
MNYKIGKDEFYEMLANGWEVIDVRSPLELRSLGSFHPSTNIPYPEVLTKRERYFPNKDAKLIIVCNAGNRSGLTASTYQQSGYHNVYVLDCGLSGL